MIPTKSRLIFVVLTAMILFLPLTKMDAQGFKEMVIDSVDGGLDISGLLNSDLSFLPVPIIITEPAVGFGGGLALGYFHKDKNNLKESKGLSPTISFGAAIYTTNNTWITMLGHQGSYLNDRVRYLGVIGYLSVNLTFYGGLDGIDNGEYAFNMKGFVTLQEVLYRVKRKYPFFVGLNYTFFSNDISFNTEIDIPELEKLSVEVNMGGVNSVFLWDGRDNTFTPTKGVFSALEAGRFATYFGGDNDYWNLESRTYAYVPIVENTLFSGYRLSIAAKQGDVPFYELPFISLRGIPMMRYQNNLVPTIETEWRWQFIRRWSLVGFVGAGSAIENFRDLGKDIKVAGGAGFRYFLAKDYGLHAGIDISRGPEIWAWNLTIGSHWLR